MNNLLMSINSVLLLVCDMDYNILHLLVKTEQRIDKYVQWKI